MRVLDVQHINGAYHIQAGGGPRPIQAGGQPLRTFNPGWNARLAFVAGENLIVLALFHENGDRAIWFLDGQFRFLANNFAELPEMARAQAMAIALTLARGVCAAQLFWGTPALHPEPGDQAFAAAAATDRHLAEAMVNACCPPSRSLVLLNAEHVPDPAAVAELGRLLGRPADPQMVLKGLVQDLKALQFEAARLGFLTMRNPLTGATAIADQVYCPPPDGLFFRFDGPRPEDKFIALLYGFQMTMFGVYYPALNLFLHVDQTGFAHIRRALGEAPERGLLRHVLHAGDRLPPPSAERRDPVILRSYDHLGHHLWNELGCLDELIRSAGPDAVPPVLVLDAEATEMYGPIDAIFPELRDKVIRTPHFRAVIDTIYDRRLLPLRPTGIHVSRGLARRIQELADKTWLTGTTARLLEGIRTSGHRLVVLGLRVENRTVVDFPSFCEDLIEMLHAELGRVAIVVDGQNSSAGGLDYRVTHQDTARETPLQVETALVRRLSRRFADHPAIMILSTIGLPVGASIALCGQAECFVTPWGAGLAKYRWVCNLPGLTIAGPSVERFQPLHLYDDPMFMEAPAPMYFMGPGEVENAPDDPVMMADATRDRVNIRVDRSALRRRLREMIAALPPREGQGGAGI